MIELDQITDAEAYTIAVATATKMRMLLDRKRNGDWKERGVIGGHLENRVELDGLNFLYSSSVARGKHSKGTGLNAEPM